MKAEFVQPVAVQEDPIFRVRLWSPPAEDGFSWLVDDWELTECDLSEALDWARQHSSGNPFELFVRAGSPDFYRLHGRPADDGGTQETIVLHTDSSSND
jgi:hypothetical protein